MADPDARKLDQIHQERAQMFRPRWFGTLIGGRLGLGETFWAGHFGIQLLLMPIWLALVVLGPTLWPGASRGFWFVFFGAELIWSGLVTRAVWRAAIRQQDSGKWRWVAVAFSALITVQAGLLFIKFLTDPG